MASEQITSINFGDSFVFQKQYEQYFTPLKYFALRYVDDAELACDFIQDIFLNLWNNRQSFQNDIAVKVFLYRAIRNSCLNYIRDCVTHEKHHQNLILQQPEETFLNNIIEAETYSTLKKIFNQLPETTRQIYQLSLEGKSHAEISELLNISINTIKKHKNTANHFMRGKLRNSILTFLLLFR